MRIIIVEDEKRSSRGLKNLLLSISEECEVVAEVSDGQKAFELILCLQPDVVFTDIKMPIMDGISMIKAVQARGGVKTRFVIISAYEEFELARQAISLGVVEYLVKPLTLEDVEAVWKRLQEGGNGRILRGKGSDGLKKPVSGCPSVDFKGIGYYSVQLCYEAIPEGSGGKPGNQRRIFLFPVQSGYRGELCQIPASVPYRESQDSDLHGRGAKRSDPLQCRIFRSEIFLQMFQRRDGC